MQRIALATVFALSLLGGCKMGNTIGPVPTKTDELEVPAGIDTARLLDCAKTSIETFAKDNSDWLPIARKDVSAGVLESRDFEPANIIGYRVRITTSGEGEPATIVLKAAGPYFMDLGADRAMADLKNSITRCLHD